MASAQSKPALSAGLRSELLPFLPSNIDLRRIYRAHVTPQEWRRPERTIFLEAFSERGAHERMAQAIAAIDRCSLQDAAERLYNVESAAELVESGLSTDPVWRIFETGWSGNEAVSFVSHPLFLVEDAAPLIRTWAAIPNQLDAAAPLANP
jgi:hypothetical protein